MFQNLRDRSKEVSLKLNGKISGVGSLPDQGKESIIVPVCKGTELQTDSFNIST